MPPKNKKPEVYNFDTLEPQLTTNSTSKIEEIEKETIDKNKFHSEVYIDPAIAVMKEKNEKKERLTYILNELLINSQELLKRNCNFKEVSKQTDARVREIISILSYLGV